ncbi:hypothetical protein LPJ66_005987 [Kickxella alabastrina]|uniref:Uncharacterized protein n=1 Tax=Kickxella alabastrina TaxID=61397 RepID=A0ACC1IGR2_9FUNG|nr:hypothetical protein LPJ66_005987 [Kickxella alabastrina]
MDISRQNQYQQYGLLHQQQNQQNQQHHLPRRIRGTRACTNCHRRKARCTPSTMPDGSSQCENCIQNKISCTWRESKRRGPKRRNIAVANSSSPISQTLSSPQPQQHPLSQSHQQQSVLSIHNLLNDHPEAPVNDPAIGQQAFGDSSLTISSSLFVGPVPNATLMRPRSLVPPPVGNLIHDFFSDKVDAELREAIIVYYTFFYSYCPILHPSTLLRKVLDGTIDPILRDSLCAATAAHVERRLSCVIDSDTILNRIVQAAIMHHNRPTVDMICALQMASIGLSSKRGFVSFDNLKGTVSNMILQLGWHEIDKYAELEPDSGLTWDSWGSVYVRASCNDCEWDELSMEVLRANHTKNLGDPVSDNQTLEAISYMQRAVSHTFTLVANFSSYLAHIGMMHRNAKTKWLRQRASSGGQSLAQSTSTSSFVMLLGDMDEFKRCASDLESWNSSIVSAETLKDPQLDPRSVTFFGTLQHRQYMVRVRYFCLDMYGSAMVILLHSSNRPSFFFEAETEHKAKFSSTNDSKEGKPDLQESLLRAFGPNWCLGLLVEDIVPSSWQLCLECAHEIPTCLRNNADIPMEFVDVILSISMFFSLSVMLRQIRRIEDGKEVPRDGELDRCNQDLVMQWALIKDLESTWNIDALIDLLRKMNIEDAAETAEKQLQSR